MHTDIHICLAHLEERTYIYIYICIYIYISVCLHLQLCACAVERSFFSTASGFWSKVGPALTFSWPHACHEQVLAAPAFTLLGLRPLRLRR